MLCFNVIIRLVKVYDSRIVIVMDAVTEEPWLAVHCHHPAPFLPSIPY